MIKSNYWIDANVIIRYLTQDNKIQSAQSLRMMEKFAKLKANGYISTLVLHEVIYVLENVYSISRDSIAKNVSKLVSISGINIIDLDSDRVKAALNDYKKSNVDFPDCVYKQMANSFACKVLSFDKDFKKIGVQVQKM